MELTIYSPQDAKALPEIKWNFEEIKKYAVEKADEYKSIAYTESDEAAMKADRADINRFVNAIEDERKRKKAEYMEPYNAFEAQVKEVLKPLREAEAGIANGLKEIDKKRRAEKEKAMEACYKKHFEGLESIVPFQKTVFEEYYKKSCSEKKMDTAYKLLRERVDGDIAAIENNVPERFLDKVMLRYQADLSLSDAMMEGKRLEEMEKTLEERKARLDAEQYQMAVEKAVEEGTGPQADPAQEPVREEQVIADVAIPVEEPDTVTIVFKVTGTRDQLMELANYMKSHGLQYGKAV